MKSSWPPIPENSRPPILSATTCPWRSTESAPLIVTRAPVAGDERGGVHQVDGEEPDLLVVVEPFVELGGTERERGDREPSNWPLRRLLTFRAVQLHQARS